MIDLHMHSLFSDGTYTPEELIDTAVREGLTAAALTDHDTIKGVARFLAAAEAHGVRGIAGVEISTSYAPGEMHLLGYFIAYKDRILADQLEWIRTARQSRNEEILHKLHKLDMPLNWREIRACATDEVIGRPHFAQAMVARGYCVNTKEAFRRYLSRGAPAYARRRTLTPDEAIEIIRGAGGVAVLAHPFTLDLARGAFRDTLAELKDMGLAGVEVYYSQHSPDRTREYLKVTNELGLVPSGGSDFHGARSPDIRLGRGFGSLQVPDEVADRLFACKPV